MVKLLKITLELPQIEVLDEVVLPAKESAVVVVDMQNDFVKPGGRLRVPAAEATVPAISRLLSNARAKNVRVFYTQDTHWPGDPEFEIWGEHALYNSWGWQIVDELKPTERDIVVMKTRYDGFYGTPLEDLLRAYRIRYTVIVGTVANICVAHTAGSAALRGFKVVVPMDGVSALNDFDYYSALRQISFLYRGFIVKSVDGIKFSD